MPDPVSLSFNDLVRMANAAPDKNIVVKDGSFKSVGKLGAFFTSKTNCRLAAQAFLEGLEKQYGGSVAHALAPELRVLQTSGKALSARTVRDLLQQAGELSHGLADLNADMARTFVDGTGIPGDTRNLDSAFADYCAAKGIDPAAQPELRQAVAGAVKDLAKSSPRLMSFAELGAAVRSMDTMPEMQKSVEVHKFLDGHIGADRLAGIGDRLRSLAAANGLDAAQTAELTDIAGLALRHAASTHDGPVTHGFRAGALQNDIAVRSYLYVCGSAAPELPGTMQEILTQAAPTPLMKDAVLLAPQLGDTYVAAYMAALENMPAIRALQPEGVPTRAAIWQGCFGEPLPDGFDAKTSRGFGTAILNKLEEMFKAASGGDPLKTANGLSAFASGLKLQTAMDSMLAPVPSLAMSDFVLPPLVTPLSKVPDLTGCEAALARDLHRRGSQQGVRGYDPVITFGAAGQPAETVRIQDVSNLSEQEKAGYYGNAPSPISRDLIARARALCGGEAQLRQVVLDMSQAGTLLLRRTSGATGTYVGEHSPVDIDVRGQADGSVTMRFHTPADSPMDADYTCTVAPSGRASITSFRMVPRPPAPPAPPAPAGPAPQAGPATQTAPAGTAPQADPAAG